ncbi:MAG TPA: nucleotidyl transferase AbiEii/AbiGii toxin family protein [Bryobacteraceae bacterium]|nr:nucleotidyl transferase AbiEii/AbiGii toxin family protein [Bryobacteraceae bacterium]
MSGRDLGASVRQRLLNRARAEGRPFQELLQYFAMERFLYRLARSPFADRFVLKGALLLTAWKAPITRPTIDIDLAGRTSNQLEHIRAIVAKLCQLYTEPDGLEFYPASIEGQRIKEDAEYEGVRIRFHATLAKARIPMQIDVGFGDVIVPKPVEVEYPAMLEFPPPVLRAYPKETVVAEKLEALTVLGMLNSRIKDYYDLALLARLYPFEGALLVKAIHSTFRHRGTTVEPEPVGLTEAFSSDPARAVQWRAFVRRSRLESGWELEKIVEQVRLFASTPLAAAAADRPFDLNWRPGGPWE